MTLASEFKLEDLVGKRVKTTREFSGIKVGDTGKVVKVYGWKGHQGIDVEWENHPLSNWTTRNLTDGFGRDKDFDETQWLEVVA